MSSTPTFILIIGPMFAGKSTNLLTRINRQKVLGKNILIVNHLSDIRYGSASEIHTHDNQKSCDGICTNKLVNLFIGGKYNKHYREADVIAIDEIQFFSDALTFVKHAVDKDKKTVIAAGLKGDFNRKPFKSISQLIPYAERIIDLQSLCKKCGDGTEAPFTKKIRDSSESIGGSELYEALCRKHFISPE